MKKILLVLFSFFILFFGRNVYAATYNGVATVGRAWAMDTSNVYTNSGWVNISQNSYNPVKINNSFSTFYIMGTEYVIAIDGFGDNYFEGYATIPVSANTLYNYQLTNGLNANDFKIGINGNFGVYNNNVNVTNFSHTCQVLAPSGVAHTYCFYTVNFNFTTSSPISGATNINFAIYNNTSSRSSYYYSGGAGASYYEFPNNYTSFNNTSYAMLRPYISVTSSFNTTSGGGQGGGNTGGGSSNQDIIDNANKNQQQTNDRLDKIDENQKETNEKLDNINDTLTDSSVDDSFLDDMMNDDAFKDSTGLDQIISLPLDFIKTIGSSCSPLSLNIPFMNIDLTIPCLSTVLKSKVPTIFTILSTIINGFILYRLLLDVYFIVKSAKDPNDDRIEVLDL